MSAPDIRIVIAQRGFVWVGVYDRHTDEVVLTRARMVRRWGTKGKSLEYIAIHGPTPDTELGVEPVEASMHWLAVVSTIKCDASHWKEVLGVR